MVRGVGFFVGFLLGWRELEGANEDIPDGGDDSDGVKLGRIDGCVSGEWDGSWVGVAVGSLEIEGFPERVMEGAKDTEGSLLGAIDGRNVGDCPNNSLWLSQTVWGHVLERNYAKLLRLMVFRMDLTWDFLRVTTRIRMWDVGGGEIR